MSRPLGEILDAYDPRKPLSHASTIPSDWCTDPRVLELEQRTVFTRSWQLAGRVDQLRAPGDFVAFDLPGGEPIVLVRGDDDVVGGFFNVCRHHAAAVVGEPQGSARVLRCPYHGWTYGLDGALKGTPDFAGVCEFDRSATGLVPIEIGVWEHWIFARVDGGGDSLEASLGSDLMARVAALNVGALRWM